MIRFSNITRTTTWAQISGPVRTYKDYPFGRRFPDISGQIGNGPVFPRAKNPRKRIKPIMDTTFLPRREVNQLRNEVARLNQVLDR